MRKYKIVCLEGDGISRETVPETLKVLQGAEQATSGVNFDLIVFPAGAEYWEQTGGKNAWPSDAENACLGADGIFKGPMSEIGKAQADIHAIYFDFLRKELDTYANLRPCRILPGVKSVLAGKKPGEIDFVVVRENTEERYSFMGGRLRRGGKDEAAVDVSLLTRKGCERVIRYAFELARKRDGAPLDKRKRVTCTCKYGLINGDTFFRDIFDEVGKEYPTILKDTAWIDAWTYWALKNPEFYDVVVTTNQYGDIISDMNGAIQGSLGIASSLCVGDRYAYAEATHGTAPDIMGKGIANPISLILSVQMLLTWMGEKYQDASLTKAANKVESAVFTVLRKGKVLTPDLGGTSTTCDVGDAISKAID
ncbi:MAG: isocitrate/isopropylmalate dehydrogenase family protein [Candidatus Bathyarchaeota archaeon]|nr:MAG: isocitrate/isopropylmalate dehydrogenase family protein [Candidatus Bathyarchaeota archaeon]